MLLRALLIGIALCFPAQAQEKKASKKPTAQQQQRMADCNKKASGKRGEERKAFMSACLKDAPQDRLTKCNHQASGKKLKGDPRKQFMSECLKA